MSRDSLTLTSDLYQVNWNNFSTWTDSDTGSSTMKAYK